MRKSAISFLLMDIVLFIVVLGFIFIVFDLHSYTFIIELAVLLIFIFFLALGMFAVYNNKSYGWTVNGTILLLLLINVLFIVMLKPSFKTAHFVTILFSIIGLVIVLLNLRPSPKVATSKIEDEKAEAYYPYIDKLEPKEEQKEVEPHVKSTFTPGKFIASKKANKYHAAKCDWALRINKANQVWFNSRKDAEAQGFEADKCVG